MIIHDRKSLTHNFQLLLRMTSKQLKLCQARQFMEIFEITEYFLLNEVEVLKRLSKCDISRQTLAPDLDKKILYKYLESSLTIALIGVNLTLK